MYPTPHGAFGPIPDSSDRFHQHTPLPIQPFTTHPTPHLHGAGLCAPLPIRPSGPHKCSQPKCSQPLSAQPTPHSASGNTPLPMCGSSSSSPTPVPVRGFQPRTPHSPYDLRTHTHPTPHAAFGHMHTPLPMRPSVTYPTPHATFGRIPHSPRSFYLLVSPPPLCR